MHLIPINGGHPLSTILFDDQPDFSAIIRSIAKENNTMPIQIDLFSDINGTTKINRKDDLRTGLIDAIYYKVKDKPRVKTFVQLNATDTVESIDIDKVDDVTIIDYFTKFFKVPFSSIKFYKNKDKNYKIRDVDDEIWKDNCERDIYFFFKPIFENLAESNQSIEGSSDNVKICTDIASKDIKVLKLMKISEDTEKNSASLTKELAIIRKLKDHPRILKFDREIVDGNTLYLVHEHMPDGSIGSLVRKVGPLQECKIKKYAKQILEGLQYLHENKIIHRNIKGDNILFDGNDNIKLSEFGLAKIIEANTTTYSVVGSANWMAPEIIISDTYDYKVDIWSFGATMVEMATGNIPLHGVAKHQVTFKIGTEKRIEFKYLENYSKEMKDFIDRCLQGDPSQRVEINELLNHPFLKNAG